MNCTRCGSSNVIKNGTDRGSRRTKCRDCGKFDTHRPDSGALIVPNDGYYVKGTSTLVGPDGEIKAQWVKSDIDNARQNEMMLAAIEELSKPLRGASKPVNPPKIYAKGMLSSYIIGDAHFGAYAWAEECGDDFDTSIASSDLRAAVDRLVEGSPPSETAYLVDLGDFLHADNRTNATPESGNLLDVDTRYQRVIRVAIDTLRYAVNRLLTKHKRVKVFITPGNHNPDSAGWMGLVLSAYYEKERRVEVENSPSKFFYERFGKCLIGITHGDKVKHGDLPSIMATDRASDWGESDHRYWWIGHIHHTRHQEYRGCTVEAFNTLAGSDAWHHASGYRSNRQMQRLDIDPEFGIYSRGIATVKMIRSKR